MASLADPGRGGKQEVARRVRARSGHAPLSYCPEEEDDREGAGGLGRPGGELGRLGCTGEAKYFLLSLSFISISVLFSFI